MRRGPAVVVGGGVIGTWHALALTSAGYAVTQLEADVGPRRASVRNFGLLWVSGRAAGDELELAVRARARWEEAAGRLGGLGFRPDGSLTVASEPAELALVEELAAGDDAAVRGLEVLDAAGARRRNPALRGPCLGALWCRLDAVVEPRAVLGALRAGLAADPGYRFLPGRRVLAVETGWAEDHTGERHRGEVVVVCPGDALDGLGGAVGAALAGAGVDRCRLQMLETAPAAERLGTAVADADTMRYYPAFDLPGRARLAPPGPVTAGWGAQLLVVQRADGALTVGDTHRYEEPFDFWVDEEPFDDLAGRAERLLGWPLPPVRRRWAGVYSRRRDGGICVRAEPAPGVVVVTAAAGRGMTLAPALAEQTVAGLVR